MLKKLNTNLDSFDCWKNSRYFDYSDFVLNHLGNRFQAYFCLVLSHVKFWCIVKSPWQQVSSIPLPSIKSCQVLVYSFFITVL